MADRPKPSQTAPAASVRLATTVLLVIGGIFVAEAVSVMLQVLWYRRTHGQRLFRMAPLHHHFELTGWSETQVVVRFWIVGILLLLVGMSSIKLQ